MSRPTGEESLELSFQVFRHEETFQSDYNVRLKKLDDETGMPLKGSQFYLYERFEDVGSLGTDERGAGLSEENINFAPWEGFQIFAEGTTDENGEISHMDSRSYEYSKRTATAMEFPNGQIYRKGPALRRR